MSNSAKNIDELIEIGCGAAAESFGAEFIKSVSADFMREYAIAKENELAKFLGSNPKFLALFCARLSVPETWFFREPESFDYLESIVKSPEFHGRRLRILSVPCSVGCEPYSIAATLLGCGVEDFEIDAFDISEKLISYAQRGVFAKNYFRERRAEECGYLQRKSIEAEMPEELKARINFGAANVLDESFGEGIYDIIFCRNLVIYLTKPARKKLFDKIISLSSQNTVVFTGHADGFSAADIRFSPLGPSRAFVVKLANPKCFDSCKKSVEKIRAVKKFFKNDVHKLAAVKFANVGAHTVPDSSTIEKIRALADCGQIETAREKCRKMLVLNPESFDLNLLAAQICSARADLHNAEKYFRRALYLAPSNTDAALGLKLVLRRNSRKKGSS